MQGYATHPMLGSTDASAQQHMHVFHRRAQESHKTQEMKIEKKPQADRLLGASCFGGVDARCAMLRLPPGSAKSLMLAIG